MLHIVSNYNFTYILTKYQGHQDTYYKLILSVFHHEGNTVSLFLDDTLEVETSCEKVIVSILGSNRISSE